MQRMVERWPGDEPPRTGINDAVYAHHAVAEAKGRFRRLVAEHRERGCGDPLAGCTCDCTDHPCARNAAGQDQPAVTCVTCRDVGFVRRRVPLGHPDFARSVPCPACGQDDPAEQSRRMQAASGVPSAWWDTHRFDRLSAGSEPRTTTERWLADGCVPAFLTLAGPNGTGKTHSAIAAMAEFIRRNQFAYFSRVGDLLDRLRATYRDGAAETIEQVERFPLAAALFVLDDLGAEKATDYSGERLFKIIEHRHSHHLPTIITTNVSPKRAESEGWDRIWSRVFGRRFATVVITGGPDRRMTL